MVLGEEALGKREKTETSRQKRSSLGPFSSVPTARYADSSVSRFSCESQDKKLSKQLQMHDDNVFWCLGRRFPQMLLTSTAPATRVVWEQFERGNIGSIHLAICKFKLSRLSPLNRIYRVIQN